MSQHPFSSPSLAQIARGWAVPVALVWLLACGLAWTLRPAAWLLGLGLLVLLLPHPRLLQAGSRSRRRLDLLVAGFLLLGVISTRAAVMPFEAQRRLGALVFAALIYIELARTPPGQLWPAASILGAGSALAGAGMMLFFTWGQLSNAPGFVAAPEARIPAGAAAGIVVIGLPLLAGLAVYAARTRRWPELALALAALLLSLAGLAAAGEVMAWGGLLAAGLLLLVGWFLRHGGKRRLPLLAPAAALALAAGYLLLRFGPAFMRPHLALLWQARLVAGDFAFSGAGLGGFAGVYSRYVLQTPYLFSQNSHALPVDLAVEMGALAPLLLALLLAASLARVAGARADPALRAALAAGMLALALGSLGEDLFYAPQALLLFFALPGLAAALPPGESARRGISPRTRRILAVTALALLALAGFTWRAPLAAGWIANRAATRMAKVELALFPQPDTVQRLSPAQLDSLRAEFERALQLDPRNLTALTRLGRIAMLGEDYAAASGYYERVLALAPDHPAAPHQLGFAYLWQQRRGEAYAVLRPHDNEVTGDLVFYVGYWNQNGRPELADEASALLALLGP